MYIYMFLFITIISLLYNLSLYPSELQTQLAELQLRLQTADAMNVRTKQVAEEEAAQLQHQIDNLQRLIESLQQQMKKERQETERLMGELQEAKLREVHLRLPSTANSDRLQGLQEERDKAVRERKEEAARTDELQRQLTAAKIQLEETKRQNALLERRKNETFAMAGNEEVRSLQSTVQKQQEEIQKLRRENMEKEEMMKEMMEYIQEKHNIH